MRALRFCLADAGLHSRCGIRTIILPLLRRHAGPRNVGSSTSGSVNGPRPWDNGNGTKGYRKRTGSPRMNMAIASSAEHLAADDGSLKGHSISIFFKPNRGNGGRPAWIIKEAIPTFTADPSWSPHRNSGSKSIAAASRRVPPNAVAGCEAGQLNLVVSRARSRLKSEWKDQWVIQLYARQQTAAK